MPRRSLTLSLPLKTLKPEDRKGKSFHSEPREKLLNEPFLLLGFVFQRLLPPLHLIERNFSLGLSVTRNYDEKGSNMH